MEQINISIITIITSGISFIMGLFMLFLHYSTTKVKGVGYWAACSLIIGFGLLFRFIPPADGFLSIVAPTLSITFGLYFYLAGICAFKKKKILKWIVVGVPLTDLIQSLIFFEIFPSPRIRMGIHAAFIGFYSVIAIYEMFKLLPEQKHLQKIFRINAISYFVYLTLVLLSLFSILTDQAYNPTILTEAGLVMIVVGSLVMTALTFGFISAVNLQLYTELEANLKSKDKFFSIIAHDLRGPVGLIMNFLNLLNTESNLSDEKRKYFLEKLEQLSQSTFHLLQNLLDWSSSSNGIENTKQDIIELNLIVKQNIDFFKNLAEFKSIEVEFIEGSISLMKGDPKMIETLLRNLFSNSLKFTPKGGKIIIATEQITDKIGFRVRDNGQGIAHDKLKNIFNFELSASSVGTEGETGSGLGLALCKEFVKKNNGSIEIKSQLNIGTEVIVQFPSSSL